MRARSFSRLICPKICYFFGKIGKYKLSLREYKLSLCFLSPLRGGRNFTTILGKSFLIFPKKWYFFGKILFSPVSVPLSKCSTVGQGRSGVRFPPGPVSLGIQLCLSMCLLSFPRRSLMDQLSFRFTFPFFCMYRMRLSLFWVHFRPHCRSVDLSCISCAFVLRFRSSECTACVYHSSECTLGPTVARSVFQFHSKKGLLGALVLRPLSLGRSLMDLLLLLWLLFWLLLLLLLLLVLALVLLVLVLLLLLVLLVLLLLLLLWLLLLLVLLLVLV